MCSWASRVDAPFQLMGSRRPLPTQRRQEFVVHGDELPERRRLFLAQCDLFTLELQRLVLRLAQLLGAPLETLAIRSHLDPLFIELVSKLGLMLGCRALRLHLKHDGENERAEDNDN